MTSPDSEDDGRYCKTCGVLMGQPDQPGTVNCGGDCCKCMADSGDQDCIEALARAIARTPWMICPTCHGNGSHSLRFGAISMEDFERDWDPDEREDYMAGRYDETCGTCRGTGKIREGELAAHYESRADRRLALMEDGVYQPGMLDY